jgi:superfamily II DNA or RNA helicase
VKLYTKQTEVVERILSMPRPVRLLLAASTGTGKTIMAIKSATELGCKRILVVTWAIVRPAWQGEFKRWLNLDAGVIDMGRARKAPSKKAAALRDAAYASELQVVSYDLLGEIFSKNWDCLIFDEAHSLGNPLSAQSKMARALCEANPKAHTFMLTATPIPTVEKQIWHVLHLLEPGRWGKPSKTNDVSWDFARKYLSIGSSEYGKFIGSSTEESRARLLADMQRVTIRLTMQDVAPEMPPLRVSALKVKSIDAKFFKEYIKALPEDVHHAAIFTHLKKTAAEVAELATELGWPVTYIDGEIPATKRAGMLAAIEAAPRALLIGTYDAFPVGVRLLWAQKVLIVQFSSSPGTMGQFLGRFASVGSAARPAVEVAIKPQDERMQSNLLERTARISSLIRPSGNEQAIAEAFEVKPQSESEIADMFTDMFASMNDTTTWGVDDEDDDAA